MRLNGAVVVITGASSGIGAATALAFARRGARLELGARRLEKLNAVAEKCRKAGSPDVNVRLLDVGQRASARAFIAATLRDHERLDVLVNNAGVGWMGRAHEMPEEKVDELIATNLKGVTRETLLALARDLDIAAEERPFTLFDVWTAREAFMCGTLAEVVPIAAVDGRTIGSVTPGPITSRLAAAYEQLVRSTGTPISREAAEVSFA